MKKSQEPLKSLEDLKNVEVQNEETSEIKEAAAEKPVKTREKGKKERITRKVRKTEKEKLHIGPINWKKEIGQAEKEEEERKLINEKRKAALESMGEAIGTETKEETAVENLETSKAFDKEINDIINEALGETLPSHQEERPISKTELKNTLVRAVNKVEEFLGWNNLWRKSPEKAAPERETRKINAKETYDILKNGIDRIVTHEGKEIVGKGGQRTKSLRPDLDADAAAFLLDNTLGKKPENLYKEGSFGEIVGKGEKSSEPVKEGEVALYIDTGGREGYEVEKYKSGGTNVFIDHHGDRRVKPTSATELVYKMLEAGGALKDKPRWLDSFVSFVTKADNLQYLKAKDENGERQFDREILENVWPKSLYGLYKDLPLEISEKDEKEYLSILQIFREGRNPWKPYSEKELKGEMGNKKIRRSNQKDVTLRELITEKQVAADKALEKVENAIDYMEKSKMAKETPELGKILYHNFAPIKIRFKKGGEWVEKTVANEIIPEMGFIAAKSLGYDTYVTYNPKKKYFFLNSQDHDLERATKDLSQIAPGTRSIRGDMVFPPKDEKSRENITEEKFLEILKIKKG